MPSALAGPARPFCYPRPPWPRRPWPASAGSSPPGTGPPSRPSVPACISTHTRVWYGVPGDGATGHIFFQLQFSNIGHSTCSFFGYPGVSAVGSHGNQVGQPASHSGTRLTVTLAPGAPRTLYSRSRRPASSAPTPSRPPCSKSSRPARRTRSWSISRPKAAPASQSCTWTRCTRAPESPASPAADRSPRLMARGLAVRGQSPSDPGLAGTSIACSRSAASGTMSSAPSWVEARTT